MTTILSTTDFRDIRATQGEDGSEPESVWDLQLDGWVCDRQSSEIARDRGRKAVLDALHRPLLAGLSNLVGEYAFVAWNRKTARLVAARDPLASKPLFWTWDGHRLAVASRIPDLLRQPGFRAQPDEGAIAELLCERPSTVEATMWEGVHRLCGGYALVVDPRHGGPEIFSFWNPSAEPLSGDPAPLLREAVDRAVRRAAGPGEKLGCELSGGYDSSTVLGVALALGFRPTPYSTVQPGEPWDESSVIQQTLNYHGIQGRDVGVNPPTIEQRRACVRAHGVLGDYVLGGEEPRRVAAAEGCQAIFTGDFGDEVFSGVGLADADGLVRLRPTSLRRLLSGPARRTLIASAFRDQVRWGLGPHVRRRWQRPLPAWVPTDLAHRVELNERMAAAEKRPPKGFPSFRYLKSAFDGWWVQSRSDQGDVDIAPRAEERSPLGDLQVVELGLRIPQTAKALDKDRRYLHRSVFADVLAPAVRARDGKAEFSGMIHQHLATGPDFLADRPVISDLGWVNLEVLEDMRREVAAARPTAAYTPRLWIYATLNELELWARELVV